MIISTVTSVGECKKRLDVETYLVFIFSVYVSMFFVTIIALFNTLYIVEKSKCAVRVDATFEV